MEGERKGKRKNERRQNQGLQLKPTALRVTMKILRIHSSAGSFNSDHALLAPCAKAVLPRARSAHAGWQDAAAGPGLEPEAQEVGSPPVSDARFQSCPWACAWSETLLCAALPISGAYL